MTTKTERVFPVAEGTEMTIGGVPYTIAPKCDTNAGNWWCLNCDEGFANQLQMHSHTMSGVHVMAWLCFQHGPEVP